MSNYYIYAHAETGYFARISDRALDDPNLIQVPSLPPDANHKWNGRTWIVLTPDEIEELIEEAVSEDGNSIPSVEVGEIETDSITIPNSIVFWGNRTGDRYCVGENPVGDFVGKQKAIAEWNGATWDFLDKDVLGYNLCSLEEKEIAAQLYIGLISDHERDFDPIETRLWREEYHELATETRLKRMLAAESLIAQELPAYQGIVMLTITSLVTELNVTGTPQMYSIDLHKNYNYFGVRSSVLDFHPIKNPNPGVGIMDYFYGTSLFTDKGLINMPFTPVNRVC